jgi:hypothetical protein
VNERFGVMKRRPAKKSTRLERRRLVGKGGGEEGPGLPLIASDLHIVFRA